MAHCLPESTEKESLCTCSSPHRGRCFSYFCGPSCLQIHTVNQLICLSLPDSFFILVPQDAEEYAELPVRHNEDQLNSQLAQQLPLPVNPNSFDSAHTKTHLLLQAHFSHAQLPCSDYTTDTKTVLDNAIRLCQVELNSLVAKQLLSMTNFTSDL